MTVKVQLKLGRRSITAEGDSRPQAQARALAEYRKKHGEAAKGATFTVIGGEATKAGGKKTSADTKKATAGKKAGGRKAKPRTDNPAPAETARPAAGGGAAGGRKTKSAETDKPARKATEAARLPDVALISPRDRIVLGWSGKTPAEAAQFPASEPIKAAKALARTPSFGGMHRQVLVIDKTYEASPVPRSLGPGRVDFDALESGDRLVLACDGSGRIIEVHQIAAGKRSLEEARALAGSDRVGGRYRFTATVHSTYRR